MAMHSTSDSHRAAIDASSAQVADDEILTKLRQVLAGMGDGGRISASVYDTAQVLRFAQLPGDASAAYAWLLDKQRHDGGWGESDDPMHRLAPTIAAMLALHECACDVRYGAALNAGSVFLAQQDLSRLSVLPDDMPIGAELILPRLCAEAQEAGLDLRMTLPATLVATGAIRRDKLREMSATQAGSPALHCWEAWGDRPAAEMLGDDGSLGLSPSATAAWLNTARNSCFSRDSLRCATHYLHRATSGTGETAYGVVPCIWPLDLFESAYILHALAMGGLLQHPALAKPVSRAAAMLRNGITEQGAGFSTGLSSDGDTTAVAMAVLALIGTPLEHDPLRRFARGHLFMTYPDERNSSLSTVIHAVHALRLRGEPARASESYLWQRRHVDGLWREDKWHASWLYATSHAVAALSEGDIFSQRDLTLTGILMRQDACGGWGAAAPTFEETAYAVLVLVRLAGMQPSSWVLQESISRAFRWMREIDQSLARPPARALWIGKQLYCPIRVVRVIELTGLWVANRWLRQSDEIASGARPTHASQETS